MGMVLFNIFNLKCLIDFIMKSEGYTWRGRCFHHWGREEQSRLQWRRSVGVGRLAARRKDRNRLVRTQTTENMAEKGRLPVL